MRLGVLDIGSNTVHLLAADVHPGGRPLATTSDRTVVRLMRFLTPEGALSEEGVLALEAAVSHARRIAEIEKVDDLLATATSAVREASNGEAVIARLEAVLGRELQVLHGEEEARLTFFAVRRWFGWSAGRLLVLDIGGGSFEITAGAEELPDVAVSLPLGAGRMTVAYLPEDPPGMEAVDELRAHARDVLAPVIGRFTDLPRPDRIAGSSKAIRSLARLAGRPASGPDAESTILSRKGLDAWIPRLARIPASARQELPGITPDRTFQIVAAAVSLSEVMAALGIDELETCPWALREGVLLRTIEERSSFGHASAPSPGDARTGDHAETGSYA